MRAFRSLPAVIFDDVPPGADDSPVRVRQKDFDGKSYFYIVNTGEGDATVAVRFPQETEDLVTGERFGAKSAAATRLRLKSYELRSFVAPSGRPAWRNE